MDGQRSNAIWEKRSDYAAVMYQRATGALPEMESSKAVARLLAPHVRNGDSLLDVGCGAFAYTGVDVTASFIEMAHRAWRDEAACTFLVDDIHQLSFADRSFDIVTCNNTLYVLRSIVQPLRELLRVARRMVLIRMLIGDRSFRIQEVFSDANWSLSQVSAQHEFDHLGEPVDFGYHNIYSRAYVEALIHRLHPGVQVAFIEDTYFDSAAINSAAATAGLVNATQVVNGMQVSGNYIIQPWMFVQISL
jgi:ubiquinone/menaquinone biosynthesis C-methylase UbiE